MTVATSGDCHGRRWWRMAMALNDDGTRELAADDDEQGARPGGEQRRHSAFIRGNNCYIKLVVSLMLGKVSLGA
jgi:hypothetical protein